MGHALAWPLNSMRSRTCQARSQYGRSPGGFRTRARAVRGAHGGNTQDDGGADGCPGSHCADRWRFRGLPSAALVAPLGRLSPYGRPGLHPITSNKGAAQKKTREGGRRRSPQKITAAKLPATTARRKPEPRTPSGMPSKMTAAPAREAHVAKSPALKPAAKSAITRATAKEVVVEVPPSSPAVAGAAQMAPPNPAEPTSAAPLIQPRPATPTSLPDDPHSCRLRLPLIQSRTRWHHRTPPRHRHR
jgi:hypothetical protein